MMNIWPDSIKNFLKINLPSNTTLLTSGLSDVTLMRMYFSKTVAFLRKNYARKPNDCFRPEPSRALFFSLLRNWRTIHEKV